LLVKVADRMNLFEDGLGPGSPPKAARGPGNRGWYDKSE